MGGRIMAPKKRAPEPQKEITVQILHYCGHTQERTFKGTEKRIESYITWMKNKPCSSCWKKEIEAEAEKTNRLLVDLIGSEKQVKWAKQIRAENVAAWLDEIETYMGEGKEKAKARVIAEANSRPLAKYWIDNRDKFDSIMPKIFKNIGGWGLV